MRKKCKGCEAKDETIAVLKEQLEWHRLHAGTPLLSRKTEDDAPVMEALVPWVREEEMDIEAMRASGALSEEAARQALEQIGAFNTDFTYS